LIAGMVPIAVGAGEGADFRAPLGQAVIGGVITSTVLTLLVIPTLYETLTDFRDWFAARVRRTAAVREPGAAPPESAEAAV
jgi:HAE1 family hydrophobic/amphiphilic exporter-1